MSQLSQREAARLWGVSRATIQRYVKAGKLSLTPDKNIDKAELVRVFGEPVSRTSAGPMMPDESGVSRSNLDLLKTENEGLRTLLAEKDARIQDLQRTVTLIEHRRRRRWWPW